MPTPVYGSSSNDGLLKSFGPFKITSTSGIEQTIINPQIKTYDQKIILTEVREYGTPQKGSNEKIGDQ